MKLLFSHPLAQVLSFCMIIVGSPQIRGPYGYFIFRVLPAGYLFAVIGLTGIVMTLISILHPANGQTQTIGLLLMAASLFTFFLSSTDGSNAYAFKKALPLATLLFFLLESILVLEKTVTWKSF